MQAAVVPDFRRRLRTVSHIPYTAATATPASDRGEKRLNTYVSLQSKQARGGPKLGPLRLLPVSLLSSWKLGHGAEAYIFFSHSVKETRVASEVFSVSMIRA